MKQMSYWARNHSRFAIGLIILLEIGKGSIGIHLGFRALPALPGVVIEFCLLAVVLGILLIEHRFTQQVQLSTMSKGRYHRLQRWSIFGLMTGSFLLALLLGNRCQFFTSEQPGYFAAQAAVHRAENRADTVTLSEPGVHKQPQNRPLTSRELRLERRKTQLKTIFKPDEPGTGVYILLALLAFGLAYVGAGLSCSLSCSNHGTAAVLVAILAVGCLAAGIYFIIRAIRRGRKKQSRAPATT